MSDPVSYRITIEPIGRVIMCREDQPILDAALRAGVWLPHSTGRRPTPRRKSATKWPD